MIEENTSSTIELTGDIVASYVANNQIASRDVAGLIAATYEALTGLGAAPVAAEPEAPKPAVSARKSLASPDHIISMIDGKPYRMLTRHLKTNGHTPKSYREAFGLPNDYPMTATTYSEKRRELAKKIGLGRKKAPEPVEAPKRRRGTIKAFPKV
jgi:predicted transcriptional regulator